MLSQLLLISMLFFHNTMSYTDIYQDTINQIKTIYQKNNVHSYQDFVSLKIIQDNALFKSFIKQIIDQDDQVISKNIEAYYHPIGFIKLVLYRGTKGEQLRLHFWGKGIKQEFNDDWEPIHNHRWNFSSKVLLGELDCREYYDTGLRLKPNDLKKLLIINKNTKVYEVFNIVSSQKSTKYSVYNSGMLAIINNYISKKVCVNQSYYLKNSIPHQVKSNANTSTILLLDPPSKLLFSEIFISNEDRFENNFELIYLNASDIKKHLKEFLTELD